MNSQLFSEYISTVLLPYIDGLRTNDEFADKEAVLLMDNCCIHVQAEMLQMLADHRVKVITLPPHTSHIFQSLFGNLKKKMNYNLPLDSDETTAGFIKRICQTMQQTVVEDNVQSSFMQIGLHSDVETSPYLLSFDEDVLRQSSDFSSIWQRDYPLEQFSPRRQNVPFGWVNQTMRAGSNR
jgi:transposase